MRTLVAAQRVILLTGTPDPKAPGTVTIQEDDPTSPTPGTFKVDRIYVGHGRDEVGHVLDRIERAVGPDEVVYVIDSPTNNGRWNVWRFTGDTKRS